MQSQNRLFDDLARVATSAMGVAAGMREEIEARLRDQFERIVNQMDLVPRDEFEAIKAVAVRAREEQETLTERMEALEARLAEAERKLTAAKPAGAAAAKRTKAAGTAKKSSSKDS